MARIEDLISSIEDPELRSQLAVEVKALKARTRFGLVYERHLPETVGLAVNGGLRVGDPVRLRKEPDASKTFRVKSIRAKQATIVAEEEEDERRVAVNDLLIVKRFGEPVFPTLTSLGSVTRSKGRPHHVVINGENYHALQLLLHSCEGQVDCIYIDPPYNTGARDWKYNNAYVDSTDSWRHSKWLSFMEKRLRMAKRLLKPDGVLIVTIDEHEVQHLGVLLEALFPEYLRYMVTIVINPKGTAKANFGRVEEYAFFVVPDLGEDVIAPLPPPEDIPIANLTVETEDPEEGEGFWLRELAPSGEVCLPAAIAQEFALNDSGGRIEITLRDDGVAELRSFDDDADDEQAPAELDAEGKDQFSVLHLRRRGAQSSFRDKRPRQFYAIKIDTKKKSVVGIGPELAKNATYNARERKGNILWLYPIDEEGRERVWRYGRDTMQKLIDAGDIRVGQHAPRKPQPYTLNHWKPRSGPRTQRIRTVWWRTSHDAGTHGTTLLSRILGKSAPFSFPKSIYAVADCLEAVVKHRKDALIVDFFAGSGTTLHSTCLLNERDGGRRRTILVTNNEVEEELAKRLNAEGLFPGDAGYEEHGIFEAVTRPRCEAVITGKRSDGEPVPSGKRYQHLDGRPFAKGFEENCEFFRLDFLDPDEIELGRCFEPLHSVFWLAAGARGLRPSKLSAHGGFVVVEETGYAVLFDEAVMPELISALNKAPTVEHVFLRTDSDDAYAEMCEALGAGRRTERLYSNYLDNFRSTPVTS